MPRCRSVRPKDLCWSGARKKQKTKLAKHLVLNPVVRGKWFKMQRKYEISTNRRASEIYTVWTGESTRVLRCFARLNPLIAALYTSGHKEHKRAMATRLTARETPDLRSARALTRRTSHIFLGYLSAISTQLWTCHFSFVAFHPSLLHLFKRHLSHTRMSSTQKCGTSTTAHEQHMC